MPLCELKLQFKNSEEVLTLKGPEVIKKCPCLERAIGAHNADWESTDSIIEDPLGIPFEKEAGDFLFAHIQSYTPPPAGSFDTKLSDYPEAAEKTLAELKQIIELANYLECTDFMHCIGFVIARKLEPLRVEEIAEYFGVEYRPEGGPMDVHGGWVHHENNF